MHFFHFLVESFVSHPGNTPTDMSVNYNATVNILEGVKKFSLKTKILIPGSGEEYGEIYKNELPIDTESILRPVNPCNFVQKLRRI